MLKKICLAAVCLLLLAGTTSPQESMSSAELVQFAVSMMGDTNQEAEIVGFDTANSRQIGYSSDGKVIQTMSYENIGNGTIMQWGESGEMTRQERSLLLDGVGDSGFTWQWSHGDVNQTINVRDSTNIYMRQIIGGIRNILFPDPMAPQQELAQEWWFCGKAINGVGGLPLCAERFAKRIFEGKASERDFYMLQVIGEEYDVFPPENLTPHVTLTKWNISNNNGDLIIEYEAVNFGKKTYNATVMLELTPRINITGVYDNNLEKMDAIQLKDNFEIKIPEKKIIDIGNHRLGSFKKLKKIVEIPLNEMELKSLNMKVISE